MTPADAVDRYLAALMRGGRKPTTIHRYRVYGNRLADMFPHVDVEDLTQSMWMKWVDDICTGHNGKQLDIDTISQRVTIAKRLTMWLEDEGILDHDPLHRLKVPKRKDPIANDNVIWVSEGEVKRMLAVAERDVHMRTEPRDRYRKLLCLGVLTYTGSRRAAVSDLRIGDYDALGDPFPTLTFHEKGGKTIKKPVPHRLVEILREAGLAGVWSDPSDHLIPPRGDLRRSGERDSKIIWNVVKEVAAEAGVKAHVHALRAAFACFFIDNKPDQMLALSELMGHKNSDTTRNHYTRRHDRQKSMASAMDLDWGDRTTFPVNPVAEKEGFEPSFPTKEPNKPIGLPLDGGEDANN